MYADLNTVNTLCINVRSGLDQAFVQAQAGMVDAYIDAKLGETFYWPNDADGNPVNNPVPALIQQIANHLTAAKCESIKFGMNEASGQMEGNPYARNLERQAKQMLEDLASGTLIIPELREVMPIRQSASPQSFFPVTGSGFGRSRGLGMGGNK